MSEEYSPLNLQNINLDALKKYIPASKLGVSPHVSTIDFVAESIAIEAQNIKDDELFIRNYIYALSVARRHLAEINKSQGIIIQKLKKVNDKESYVAKKLQYFNKRYQAAKDEIVEFIVDGIRTYVSDHYSDLIDRSVDEKCFLGPRYDYQYNAQFYNLDYDFSTYVKFYYVPGIPFIEVLKNIEKYIELKISSVDEYYEEVIRIVDENDIVSNMSNRVGENYHIHTRKEIFEAMTTLFNEGKYLAFISMATIQLEGIFYELVCIKFGRKERQGTLVEKVEKAFKDNRQLMQTLYPYFAFDIPELRNEIAHKGIVEERNLKKVAYELVLDLNCVLHLTESASTDKFKQFWIIASNLEKIKKEEYDSFDEYEIAIARQLIAELYMSSMISMDYFWDVLVDPEAFDEEMEYYKPEDLQEDEVYLKDIVYFIVDLTRRETFWKVILDELDEMIVKKAINEDELNLFVDLKTRLIGILKGEAKVVCCNVNAKIEQIEEMIEGME